MLRAGKQALHRGTEDGKEHLRTICTNSNFFGVKRQIVKTIVRSKKWILEQMRFSQE